MTRRRIQLEVEAGFAKIKLGKDPLEDFGYNDPRCNPLLRLAAARTPSNTTAHQPASCVCLTHFFYVSLSNVSESVCENYTVYAHSRMYSHTLGSAPLRAGFLLSSHDCAVDLINLFLLMHTSVSSSSAAHLIYILCVDLIRWTQTFAEIELCEYVPDVNRTQQINLNNVNSIFTCICVQTALSV
ncbi:hypothetical protein F511_42477 [Dorcoceras hygrometricum]|uniref:Uncharacterized protein n=1 Tax=Dorcoceras hygrometricum TaxID=472368 RepID=A0A2Z7CP35_9LAMI|nr:hypothetical protein F511_42477 [Dorcoceras hygrometricum]